MKTSHRRSPPAVPDLFPFRTAFWFEPAMFGILLLGTFLLTPPPVVFVDGWSLRVAVGRYLTPVLDQSLPVLGVVGGVVVTLAVWTRLGQDASTVPAKLRRTLETLLGVIGLFLVSMALCVVYVAFGDSTRWPEVAIALVLSWVLSLTCRVALGVPSYAAQAERARRRWHRARKRAARYGLKRRSRPPRTSRSRVAVVALSPVVLWACVTVATVAIFWDATDPWQAPMLTFYAILPTLSLGLLSLTWVGARDRSAEATSVIPPIIFLGPITVICMVASVLLTVLVPAAPVHWHVLGCIAAVLFVACAVFRFVPQLRRSIGWIAESEDAVTIRALRRARREARRLQRLAAQAVLSEREV
ncbi:lipid-A-disaccharide synthase-like uncharacterized protein [Microbacterium natoriense]|uniref:Lipid-A-disaccharide synthase-like uncharacterized protein n=1 Tax=Microbacterium natoriense TaxID=284570 RepID=A0AAW8EVW0_9MICO|nr:hypothetical protein [Microbacterium natoriense]MDQ0646955.1 lipid-A-disaccharide synthase-like uncharacterized protein [Microbacterium natoriense]